jgi:hypothetical protein
MRRTVLAAIAAASIGIPAIAQTVTAPTERVVVTEEQMAVPEEAPGGSSSPMGVSAGVGVGVVVIGIGLIIACGIACAN